MSFFVLEKWWDPANKVLREFELRASSATALLATMNKFCSSLSNLVYGFVYLFLILIF